MAQITTATEFCNNHKEAITQDKNISIQKSLSGVESCLTFLATSAFLSGSKSKNSILLKNLVILSHQVSDFLLIFSST
jgi:hypothetical protein